MVGMFTPDLVECGNLHLSQMTVAYLHRLKTLPPRFVILTNHSGSLCDFSAEMCTTLRFCDYKFVRL